jgi:hypothetical protein
MQVAEKDILVFPDQCASNKCSKGKYIFQIVLTNCLACNAEIETGGNC